MPQNVQDKLKSATPALAFSETQLYWPARYWHLSWITGANPIQDTYECIQCWVQKPIELPQATSGRLNQFVSTSLLLFLICPRNAPILAQVVSLCRQCFVLSPVCPEWQISFIWETPPLYSISSCLCSGLCVSPSCWLGCIMWLMSSGQSAVGTRMCSGDPEADWRPANGEDTMTSGCAAPNWPVNYASGHSPCLWNQLSVAGVASGHANP